MEPNGARTFFFTNPNLAGIWGDVDVDFDNFYFWDFVDPKSPDFQVPKSPNSQICRSPDFQTPAAPAPPEEFSDPNLTPLPNAPRNQNRRREPLLR